jgi:hypothetical protein
MNRHGGTLNEQNHSDDEKVTYCMIPTVSHCGQCKTILQIITRSEEWIDGTENFRNSKSLLYNLTMTTTCHNGVFICPNLGNVHYQEWTTL